MVKCKDHADSQQQVQRAGMTEGAAKGQDLIGVKLTRQSGRVAVQLLHHARSNRLQHALRLHLGLEVSKRTRHARGQICAPQAARS